MKAESPVVVGLEQHESFKGGPRAGQPQYLELPCLLTRDGAVLSRWELTAEERTMIANGADVFLRIYCGDRPYPPTIVQVLSKEVCFGGNPEDRAMAAAKYFDVIPLADMSGTEGMLRNEPRNQH